MRRSYVSALLVVALALISAGNAAEESTHRYRIYEDSTEKAFTVLVPDGWQIDGGVMQYPPNPVRTVVDMYGKKILFSVFDPESGAAVQYFPYEMIHSAAPGSVYIQVAPGQVLNGMIQMPSLLSPSDYARQVMFPMARLGASDVKWHRPVELESLARAWYKAVHANDPVKPSIKAQSVEVSYQQEGVAYKEVWTVLITATQVASSTIWSPDITVAARAPVNRFDELKPVLEAVITSFRLDSNWYARAIARFIEGTEKVRVAQDQIRKMDQAIQKHRMQIQDEVRRIDRDITSHRAATDAAIHEQEHNVLMGVDEYRDPVTDKRALLDLTYRFNYTDGENVIQTNDRLFEPPPEYREMTHQ